MVTIPESHTDLLSTDVAMLATQGQDGHPQVTAVGFLLDDGLIKLSLNTSRQKTKNLKQRPACTLFVLDRTNPYRTLEIRAIAELSPDDDYRFADKLGAKYGGMNLRKMDQPGQQRVVVTLRPVKVNGLPSAHEP
jgi:PPOX class probable F420-dependent enzyme